MTRQRRVWAELGGGMGMAVLAVGALLWVHHPAPSRRPPSMAAVETPMARAAEPVASYTLFARLDADQHIILGRGEIRWKNASTAPANELYLHLYLNAFEHENTLFLRSPFGGARSGLRPERWGSIELKRLVARELGQVDLLPSLARHSPDDPSDRTDLRVPLPSPIEPGQELTLEVAFESKLPSLVERTGFWRSFHLAGQWFPKLARREPDGTWRHFPFHPQAEFYADFGRYSVTIDVPDTMLVGATGPRVFEQVMQGRRVVRHEVNDVHDFAWTAWDGFHRSNELVDGIRIELLFPPSHRENAQKSLQALRFALPAFDRWLGRYPYPVLTVVEPPRPARFAGGMEYPTLITTGAPWWAGYLTRELQAVTVHELAHQWFYGMVATNEAEWPWLDEGLATYAQGTVLGERFGPGSFIDWPGLVLSEEEARRVVAQAAAGAEVIAQPARRFASFASLGEQAYARTATALTTLGNLYGSDRVARALGYYAREQRFQHPGPEALFGAVERELGADAAHALRAVVFERARVDYRVRWLTSFADPSRTGSRPAPSAPRVSSAEPENYLGRVLVVRQGTLRFPVELELVDTEGGRQRQHWDGQDDWAWITYQGRKPLLRAVVDPERKIALDDDFTNNAIENHPDRPLRTLEAVAFAAELALGSSLW